MSVHRLASTRDSISRWSPLIIGIAALLFTALITIWLPPDPATPWLHAVIYLALFILARLSTISFHGTGFSLSHVILVSAFLTLDLAVALWIGFAGTLVEHVARLASYARRAAEPGTARDALDPAGAALGEATFSVGAAGLAFHALGGGTPITEIDLSSAVPILALFVVYSAADTLFQATFSRPFDPSTSRRAGADHACRRATGSGTLRACAPSWSVICFCCRWRSSSARSTCAPTSRCSSSLCCSLWRSRC